MYELAKEQIPINYRDNTFDFFQELNLNLNLF